MTYLSDKTKSRRRIFKTLFIIVALSILSFGWIQIRSTLSPVVVPTFVASDNVFKKILSIPYSAVNYFRSRDSFVSQIDSLEKRTEELENQIADMQANSSALDEPQTKTVADVQNKKIKTGITLYPLAQDLTRLYSTILLSKGFKDGVVDESVVYIRGRQAVCTIVELHASTSLCKLLSYSGNSIDGVTKDTMENITLVGDGGGNYISMVPKESNYKLGEDVMYKSDPTLKLGNIVDIKNDPQDVFVRVYIRGSYNPVTSSVFYVDNK